MSSSRHFTVSSFTFMFLIGFEFILRYSVKKCSHFIILHICCCSVAQLFQTLCDPENCSTPGFPSFTFSHNFLKFISIELVMPSNHLILYCPLTSCLQYFPSSGSFPKSHFLTSGDQSIGLSASASNLPMNIRD